MKIITKFKNDPKWYYAFSIAASWTGCGAMMNSITLTTSYGLIPSIIWGFANTVACILFVFVVSALPDLRRFMQTKAMKYLIGFLSVFQIWINMTGIYEIFEPTSVGALRGRIIAYVITIGFIVYLLNQALIKNVLTDNGTIIFAYGLLVVLTIIAFAISGGKFNNIQLGIEWSNLSVGLKKGMLLLFGPFTYPYFYKLLDYNDNNDDGTARINIKWVFTMGGLLFGFYMIFTYLLALVQFTDMLNILKAIIITFVAASTISTFVYSEYIVFGKKGGLAVNVATVVLWQILIPLGVMGIWTLMGTVRVYIFGALIIAALVLKVMKK